MNYVDLHIHTSYTKGNGITQIPALCERAQSYGMEALALVDSATVAGFPEFCRETAKAGLKAIYGCGFYFAAGSRFDMVDEKYHLVLLAESDMGFANLLKLVDMSYTEGHYIRPRIDLELLEHYSEGLICLTGGLGGAVDKWTLIEEYDRAEMLLKNLQTVMDEHDLFLEIQNNGLPKNEKMKEEMLNRWHKELDIPLVVSGGSFYLDASDAEECNRIRKEAGNGLLKGDGYYFRSPEEIDKLFSDIPQAIANSGKIAARCNVNFSCEEIEKMVVNLK